MYPIWKVEFLHVPAIKLYRVEAVGQSLSSYAYEYSEYVKCVGNFMKNWYFVNNLLNKVWILKSFCIYVTRIIEIIYRTSHNFFST